MHDPLIRAIWSERDNFLKPGIFFENSIISRNEFAIKSEKYRKYTSFTELSVKYDAILRPG